ncbi:MAG: SdrD B-like domain-containing protein [bacterium]
MYIKHIRNFSQKFVPSFLIAILLLQNIAILLPVKAQEASPAPTPTETASPEPTSTVTSTPAPTETIVEATATATPTVESTLEVTTAPTTIPEVTVTTIPEPTTPITVATWKYNSTSGEAITNNNVEENIKYTAPQNSNLSITFTNLPKVNGETKSGKLIIEQVTLTADQVTELNALSNIAYDVRVTNLVDGEFTYNMTFPSYGKSDAEMVYSEDGSNYLSVNEANSNSNYVTVNGLNHFTLFVTVNPSTASDNNGIGNTNWINTNRIYNSDDQYARVDLAAISDTSHYLTATNFANLANIPSNAIFKGIEVSIERKTSSPPINVQDVVVSLIVNGTIQGENKAYFQPFASSDSWASYGGSTDKWGIPSLSLSDIQNSNFGVAFAVSKTGGGSTSITRVDQIQVIAYYDIPIVISYPANYITISSANLTHVDWNAIPASTPNQPYHYQYQVFTDPNYTSMIYNTTLPIPTNNANGTSDGTYYIRVRGIDNLGSYTEWSNDPAKPFIITVDSIAPVLKEVTAVTPNPTTDNTPDYVFNSTEAGTINYTGGCTGAASAIVGDNPITFNLLADGTYNCTISVTDAASNVSNVLTLAPLTIDTTAPSDPTGLVIIPRVDPSTTLAPVACGSYINTNYLIADWNDSSDAGVGFDHYDYRSYNIGGAPGADFQFTSSIFDSNWFVPTDGTYGWQVRAVDKLGNASAWVTGNDFASSCQITIDRINPVVDITAPLTGSTIKGTTPIIATIADANLLNYTFTITDNATSAVVVGPIVTPDSAALVNFLYNWDTTTVPNATYTIKLEALDKATNQGSDSIVVKVENVGSIQGYKYEDFNNNSTLDVSEKGKNNWTINLYDRNWQFKASTVTANMGNGAGEYQFTGLIFGSYYVCETAKNAWIQTGPLSGASASGALAVANLSPNVATEGGVCWQVAITIPDQAFTALTFGNFQKGSISGYKFSDEDHDGTWDQPDEKGIPNWTIFIDQNGNNTLDAGETKEKTDATGKYEFKNLLPGNYRICEDQKPGWLQTFGQACYDLTIATSNQEITGINFGNSELGSIAGKKIEDYEANGVLNDPNDKPIGNYSIELYAEQPNGVWTLQSVQQTKNGINNRGNYKFTNLLSGTYYVCEAANPDYLQTVPAAANYVNQLNGIKCYQVKLDAGIDVTNQDFGNFKYATLTVKKYEDMNGDGFIDANDVLHNGTEINLTFNTSCFTGTDGLGTCVFKGLTAQQYTVNETIAAGWTRSNVIGNTVFTPTSGGSYEVDFLNYRYGAIQGRKFEDVNGNGKIGGPDTEITGWNIKLFQNGGLVSEQLTHTLNSGVVAYRFKDLAPGTYQVCEEMQTGWSQVLPNSGTASPDNNGTFCRDVVVTSGSNETGEHFLNFKQAVISGVKFSDTNYDHLDYTNETKLSGWDITIDLNNDGFIDDTQTTDQNGYYEFTGIPQGTYPVCEIAQAGWVQSYPDPVVNTCHLITVKASGATFTANFGNTELGFIQGRKFSDANIDHKFTSGEQFINDWQINLYVSNGDGGWNAIDSMTTGNANSNTNSDYTSGNVGQGQYRFTNLLPGEYKICEKDETANKWIQTRPEYDKYYVNLNAWGVFSTTSGEAPVCFDTYLDAGEHKVGVRFGNYQDNVAPTADPVSDISFDEGSYFDAGILSSFGTKGIHDNYELGLFEFAVFYNGNPTPFWVDGVYISGLKDVTYQEIFNYLYGAPDVANPKFPVDTSVLPEGNYEVRYFLLDSVGNSACSDSEGFATDCPFFTFTINNVAPGVTLNSNQTINEGQTASFNGSFTDPSYMINSRFYAGTTGLNAKVGSVSAKTFGNITKANWKEVAKSLPKFEAGKSGVSAAVTSVAKTAIVSTPNYPDDSNWLSYIDYGDGAGFAPLTAFGIPGAVAIADHTYPVSGVYPVTLKVCEGTEDHDTEYPEWFYKNYDDTYSIISGEGNCTTATVNVTVNNLVPGVTINPNPGTHVYVGTTVTLTADGTGGNAPLAYQWSGACSGINLTATLPNTAGTYTCTVTVTDVDGDTASSTITVTVSPRPVIEETTTTVTPTTSEIPSPTPTGAVLGITCKDDEKQVVSGYVYLDANKNEKKDADEKGIENVEVTIKVKAVDGFETIITVKTDKNGYWEATVCPGSYVVEINKKDLPSNTKVLGDDTKNIKIADSEKKDVNFSIQNTKGFNWWLCIIPLIILIAVIMLLLLRQRKNEKQ